MYLIFDAEATGLPKKWKSPASDSFNWPRMIQLAWRYYDEKRELIEEANFIIKPESYEIPPETERFHGINTARAMAEGHDLKEVLQKFIALVDKAEYLIAHNINFNSKVVAAECHRKSLSHRIDSSEQYCTMQEGTWFCKIYGKGGKYKWPSLTELFTKTFGMAYENPGHAEEDVTAATLVFFKLVDKEVIDLF